MMKIVSDEKAASREKVFLEDHILNIDGKIYCTGCSSNRDTCACFISVLLLTSL